VRLIATGADERSNDYDGALAITTTDASGRFTLRHVPSGTHARRSPYSTRPLAATTP